MKYLNSQINLPRLLKKLVSYSMLIICFILFVSPTYGSKEQVAERLTEAGEEQLLMFFDPDDIMVTTGAGRPLSKKKMPATVTVITAEELKLLGLRHLTDVINYIVPGGTGDIHRGDKSGLYAFRGICTDTNNKYVIMIDGLNINNITAKGANAERYLGLMDELDRIEIVQGVGSSLYGSGATSGVINFITKTGKAFQGAEIYTGYGSWEKYEATVKYGKKRAEDNHDFFYFGWKRSDGSRPRGGEGDISDTSKWISQHAGTDSYWDHYAPSYKFHGNIQRGDFSLSARFVHDQFEEPYLWDINRNDQYQKYVEAYQMYVLQNYFFIKPEIKHQINENQSIKANLAFIMEEQAEIKMHDWYSYTNKTDPDPDVLIREGGKRRFSWGEKKLRGQFFHYYDGWADHKLTSGLDLFWIRIGADFRGRNFKYIEDNTNRRRSKEKTDLYYVAGFVEDIWKLDEKTTLFAGVRVENHELTEASISPRAAISHDYDEKTTLKFLYGSGFRTPFWVGYTTNKSALEQGKPTTEPDPEEVRNFEAHIIHRFSPKFTGTLVGYYTIYKDLIGFWSGSDTYYYNFPEVKAAGLEFVGDYRTKNLKLKFSHSYSRPVHLAGSQFNPKSSKQYYEDPFWVNFLSYGSHDWAQFPTHMTKVQAIINLIEDKATLGLTYFRPWGIRGQKDADSKLKWPRNLLNATLTLNLKEDMELQVTGYNLLGEDRPWWGSNSYEGVSRAVNPHTEYFVRMIWKF